MTLEEMERSAEEKATALAMELIGATLSEAVRRHLLQLAASRLQRHLAMSLQADVASQMVLSIQHLVWSETDGEER